MRETGNLDWRRVEALFHGALEQAPPEREQWLDEQTGGESGLRSEVASLLDALHQHQEHSSSEPAEPVCEPAPVRFGAYETVRLLGRGGMGAVYLARRVDGQFDQTVALKSMASYLGHGEFLRKFQTERQLLASLNHPNVTRLLDGGVTAAGEPYLVMEYVDGKALDRYCDERVLSVDERLRLFVQVCAAVDYAHRNLIVHRDLKPSNILVTADGTAKLLDFGTASLMEENRDVTLTAARMLTPRYASPEALRGERANPASDIFSLGIILYELLTGGWPFGNPSSVVSGLERATRDVPPAAPSGAVTERAAAMRAMTRDRLRKLLEGDLTAITLKCLENAAARRYDSANQLAADVERFLQGRPVLARAQTPLYRAGKFVRRRWLPVTAAAIFAGGLMAATIVSVRQARVAREEALKAEKVSQFLSDMLSSASENEFDPQKFTVAQMLDRAGPRLEQAWKDDPLIEATLRTSLGNSYEAVQRHDDARVQLKKARATFHVLGKTAEEAAAVYYLGINEADAGLPHDAVRYYRECLAMTDRLGKKADPLLVFRVKESLGDVLAATLNQDLDDARRLFSEAIQTGERNPAISRAQLAVVRTNRAALLLNDGKAAEAEAELLAALETFRREKDLGIGASQAYYELMILKSRAGDLAAAREYARQFYEVREKYLGAENGQTVTARITWARFRAETGEASQAADQVLEAVPAARRGLPPLSSALWTALTCVSHVLNLAGRYREAEPYAREEMAIIENQHTPELDARRAQSLYELGRALGGERKDGEALGTLARSLKIYQQLGPNWAASVARVQRAIDEARTR